MRIGFDAKRAFHNFTGLGNYSRTLIQDISTLFPDNDYILFNTRASKSVNFSQFENIKEVLPRGFFDKKLTSLWRSRWMLKDIKAQKIDLYHGLSHEIPYGLSLTGVKSVVSIHDLIYEHYPEQYKPLDVLMYRKKYRYACTHATHLIAISEQTKLDLMSLYGVPESKITVCYQSCAPEFSQPISDVEMAAVRTKYQLPETYILYVGSIIERKNLLQICKALHVAQSSVPLVVVGNGKGTYRKAIIEFLKTNKMEQQVIFLSEQFGKISELPVLYKMAKLFIYPSYYEGFGIPVLEAMSVGVPVITSNVSCLPEVGGDAAFYVNPDSVVEIAQQIQHILHIEDHSQMIQKGKTQAAKFSNEACAIAVMEVYRRVLG